MARATAHRPPASSRIALTAWYFRPSRPRSALVTTWRAPTVGSLSTRAAMRPSTNGPSAVGSANAGALLGQSSAAHTIGTLTSVGTHGAANSPVGSTVPANRRRPSPSARSGPHAKQVGNGCRDASRNVDAALAVTASSHPIPAAARRRAYVDGLGDEVVAVAQLHPPVVDHDGERALEWRRAAQRDLDARSAPRELRREQARGVAAVAARGRAAEAGGHGQLRRSSSGIVVTSGNRTGRPRRRRYGTTIARMTSPTPAPRRRRTACRGRQ